MVGSPAGGSRTRPQATCALSLAAVLWAAASGSSAQAVSVPPADCVFDAGTRTATVTIPATGYGPPELDASSSRIYVDRVPCGEATPANTDTVVFGALRPVIASNEPDIEIAGPLGPGATDEPGASDEIEVEFASPLRAVGIGVQPAYGIAPATVVAGAQGINLNANELDGVDADVIAPPSGYRLLRMTGAGGSDRLDARGGAGTGGPAAAERTELFGGAGDDDLEGGGGGSVLLVGGGNDDVLASLPAARTVTASYADSPFGVTVDLRLAGPQSTGFGEDTLSGVDSVAGSDFADHLIGNDAANRLSDGSEGQRQPVLGRDIFEGLGGDDDLSLDSGGLAFGGAGNDVIIGAITDDHLDGGEGEDRLIGRAGNDTIDGGPGNDSLSVELDRHGFSDKADMLSGGPGDDFLSADGAGDVLDGGEGVDTASMQESAAPVTGSLSTDEVRLADGSLFASIPNTESLFGGSASDVLVGDAGPNTLFGFGGDDRIVGGAGEDWLDGMDGRNRIEARDGGPDRIACQPADEVLVDRFDHPAGCSGILEPVDPARRPADRPLSAQALVAWISTAACLRSGVVLIWTRLAARPSLRWVRARTSRGTTIIRGADLARPIRIPAPRYRRFGIRIDVARTGAAPAGVYLRYRRCSR